MKQKLKFPKGFLWGAATAAHQIEGNNTHSDWWAWEHGHRREEELKAQGKDPKDYFSGIACDSYHRYDEDFSLAEHLNQNSTRLSVEWARIEPREGEFDEAALEHYEKVLRSAKSHGLKTFVTLHHFTLPKWFAKKGGFENFENIKEFVRYAKKVCRRLDEYVDFWITINEPEVYAKLGFLIGKWPPQKRSLFLYRKVLNNLIEAHNQIAKNIRSETSKPVGIVCHISDLRPSWPVAKITTAFLNYFDCYYTVRKTLKFCDFIGLNYYRGYRVGFFGSKKEPSAQKTDLGWGISPEGLERVLKKLKTYGNPVYITENGLADARDEKREKFIKDHLYFVHRAISQGVDVRGYLHWSLIDNFEWADGFYPRFGLIEVDREDLLRRKVRYSAARYSEICKNNYMEH